MPRRSTGRSTTIGRTTGSTKAAVERLESELQESALREDAEAAAAAQAAQESAPEPVAAKHEPEILSTGLVEGEWAGRQFWHCPRCGRDEFSRSTAETHACKGRVPRPYKGE